jgi:hypothetical protein
MRNAILTLAMLIAALAGSEARSMIPALTLPADRVLPWSYGANPRPLRYRWGDLLITISTRRTPDGLIEPIVSVSQPRPVMQGPQPPAPPELSFRSFPAASDAEHGLSVGRLDAEGHRYVMWQAYTGGAHCCFLVQLLLPDGPERGVVSLGDYDMEMMTDLPTDIDGDGRTDFVFRDNAFLYGFASFAGSFALPQIWNVEGGRAVDVSAAPRYRALFVDGIAETRPICLDPRGGDDRNGACAAFVAASARIGDFEAAWQAMLGGYDRRDDAHPGGPFPQRLRAFLVAHGYLRE